MARGSKMLPKMTVGRNRSFVGPVSNAKVRPFSALQIRTDERQECAKSGRSRSALPMGDVRPFAPLPLASVRQEGAKTKLSHEELNRPPSLAIDLTESRPAEPPPRVAGASKKLVASVKELAVFF